VRLQVLRPPYCYRWTVLIGVVASAVWLSTSALSVLQSGASGPPPIAAPAPPPPEPAAAPAPPPKAAFLQQTGNPGQVIALTFDDGPHPQFTRQVLALLRTYRAVATFCMVGVEVQRHPDVVREVVAAGMALCAHTMTHDEKLPTRPAARMQSEIVGSQHAIADAAGPGSTVGYFRAPAGNWSDEVKQTAAGAGMASLSWSVDSRDWQRPGVGEIVRRVQQGTHPGAIILLHDGGGTREQTVEALAQLLPWFVQQGYRFGLPS
jgi:peptidoglycan-N-acetylglucosamine deacetylase